MTETTSINRMVRERRVSAPQVVRRRSVANVTAQAAAGFIAANFLLILARILLVSDADNIVYLFALPVIFVFTIAVGVPAGLFVWAGFETARNTLNTFYRTVIAVATLTTFFVGLAVFLNAPLPDGRGHFWVLAMVLAPGIGVGLVTGSQLRLWHELVRGGDRVGIVLTLLAGFSGLVLRLTVAVLFMVSAIALISILQSPYYRHADRVWAILAFGHFTAAFVLVFARLKMELLLPLAVIVTAPVAVRFFVLPEVWELVRYAAIGYLALWTAFVLTRWRLTQVAVSVLNEEFRYYLID